jgi:hypothetical protein
VSRLRSALTTVLELVALAGVVTAAWGWGWRTGTLASAGACLVLAWMIRPDQPSDQDADQRPGRR